MKKNKLKANNLSVNNNITLLVGSIQTVKRFSEKLQFSAIFDSYKKKGRALSSLLEALVSYKLTENFSISKVAEWINKPELLKEFNLKGFEQRTLFRCLETIGDNSEEILENLRKVLFLQYSFESTDTVLDWSSLVLYGTASPLGKRGYSRDHRPDKEQITFGVSQLTQPINVPIGLTICKGNTNDMTHFSKTFNQITPVLKENSLIVFDKGAHLSQNIELVKNSNMKYLTAKKLNKSDDKRIKVFDPKKATIIDNEDGIYGVKFETPSKFDYLFFSEKLKTEQITARKRKAQRKFEQAKQLQDRLDAGKGFPARYKIRNELIDLSYSYQTKLKELGEERAKKFIENVSLNGREGFFCLTSSKNLTVNQVLQLYRKKDSIEKTIHSLKNEIEIKPVRVWTTKSVHGALIIGFLAQLIISLLRYEHEEINTISTKFIKKSLMNLTVTNEKTGKRSKRRIYSNFDVINTVICCQNRAIS